jgi:hypothetical protein
MLRSKLSSALIAATLLASSVCLLAQAPPPEQPHHEMPRPTNLQVLPKDISTQDLLKTMHAFTQDLGVHCTFCHAEDAATHRPDFASDAKPEKAAARTMMRMTHEIDTKYLAELPDHGAMAKVGCGTCHRGQSTPPEFTPAPEHHGPPPPSGD